MTKSLSGKIVCEKHQWPTKDCVLCMSAIYESEQEVGRMEARIAELEARELGWLTTLSSMELEARQLRDATFAVGEVREHNGSLMVIGALHPQIELDTLPIGTKVYIKLGGGE